MERILLLFCLFFFFQACELGVDNLDTDPDEEECASFTSTITTGVYNPNANKPVIEPLWTYALSSNHQDIKPDGPIMTADGILIAQASSNFSGDLSLSLIDEHSGESLWQWDDFAHPYQNSQLNYQLVNEEVHISNEHFKGGITCLTGETLWSLPLADGIEEASVYNDLIFAVQKYGSKWHADSVSIMMKGKSDHSWETIYTVSKTNDFAPAMSAPVVYSNDANELMLFFYTTTDPSEGLNFIGYNLTQGRLDWKSNGFSQANITEVLMPKIDGNRIYHAASEVLFCRDANTGELIWERSFARDAYYFDDATVFYENIWILSNYNREIIAVDKFSGSTVWELDKREKGNELPEKLRINHDKLYFVAGELYIVDAASGLIEQIIEKGRNAAWQISWHWKDAYIDFEKGIVYASTNSALVCFELPEQ